MNPRAIFLLLLSANLALAMSVPNPTLTPGDVDPTHTEGGLCAIGGGNKAYPRHVTQKIKREVCQAYGIKSGCPGKAYEIDHKIPHGCGGSDTAKNLWPQPIEEAKIKDKDEDHWSRMVCDGQKTMEECQAHFKNWPLE